MRFIFPKNYNFKNKILGIIDYPTALINLLWYVFMFVLVNIFFESVDIKIFVFICFCFPLLLLTFSGFHGENIIVVIFYMFKFFFRPKLFLYNKIMKN